MCGLRKIVAAITLCAANQALAVPASLSERAILFAMCTGRLSALEEHQRLFDGAASERTAARKAQFAELLRAVEDDAISQGLPTGLAMERRVSAKAAQRSLLSQATFASEPRQRVPAQQAADRHIASCLGLLPSS